MRARLVLDASAAAAVVFLEPDAQQVLAKLLRASSILVPPLFGYELANVGRTKVSRGEVSWARARRLLRATRTWPVRVVEVRWERAWRVARATGLTVFDAVYLGLARAERARILTLDAALAEASGRLLA